MSEFYPCLAKIPSKIPISVPNECAHSVLNIQGKNDAEDYLEGSTFFTAVSLPIKPSK